MTKPDQKQPGEKRVYLASSKEAKARTPNRNLTGRNWSRVPQRNAACAPLAWSATTLIQPRPSCQAWYNLNCLGPPTSTVNQQNAHSHASGWSDGSIPQWSPLFLRLFRFVSSWLKWTSTGPSSPRLKGGSGLNAIYKKEEFDLQPQDMHLLFLYYE